jgi:glycosyltransferase involved in cell wall biosynthesis
VALVTGTTAGGTGAHVRMLAAGLAARGTSVTVVAPASVGARFGLGALDGVRFTAAEFGDRPRPGDVRAVARLRRALRHRDPGAPGGAQVVHAHGLRAGALTAVALGPGRGGRRPGLVVTVHNAPPAAAGVTTVIYRLLERLVARRADLVLGVSADLEARLRAAGARRVGRAVVAAPAAEPAAGPVPSSLPGPVAAAVAAGRPVVLAVGRLTAQKNLGLLLDAAPSWRDLDPEPRLVIAGDGPAAAQLRAKADDLGLDVAFLGQRSDIGALLGAAAVLALPSRWEGQPLIAAEALRAAVPIVATRVGGVPDLVGEAALLVEPGSVPALAAAVRAVLTDPALAARLAAASAARAAGLPTAEEAVTAALACYARVCR